MDPAEQLKRIYEAGFELQTFDRYPSSVGIVRGNCIALMRATPTGLQYIGLPGWRMGEVLGVQIEREGRQYFQNKTELIEATPERLNELRMFREELDRVLTAVV